MTATRGCNADGTGALASLTLAALNGDSEWEETGEGGTIVDAGDGDRLPSLGMALAEKAGRDVRLDSG